MRYVEPTSHGGCWNCRATTLFTPVRIGDAVGLMCLTCGKRWVVHYCSRSLAAAPAEPELLPLLIDFGVKAAYDPFCPGCRRAIDVVTNTAKDAEPYNPALVGFLRDAAQFMTAAAIMVTAVGAARWAARQLC